MLLTHVQLNYLAFKEVPASIRSAVFGKMDLLKWFGGREKAFSKYACDFLNLSARKKKKFQ